jgi:shikimate kinase
MNLVFIYGPPAAGKLTIGSELAAITGYRLFHNHLTHDLAKDIYPARDSLRFDLVDKLRLMVFNYAAEQNTDLITTFVYDHDKQDKQFIDNVVKLVRGRGGNVFFVQLTAEKDTLLERVSNQSRTQFSKLTDQKILQDLIEKRDINSSVEYGDVLKIDTSIQSAKASAKQIKEHFDL